MNTLLSSKIGENKIVYAVVIDKYQLKNQLNASGKTAR